MKKKPVTPERFTEEAFRQLTSDGWEFIGSENGIGVFAKEGEQPIGIDVYSSTPRTQKMNDKELKSFVSVLLASVTK